MAISSNFEVIYLGQLSKIDSPDKNDFADYASRILGSYGSQDDLLAGHVHNLTAVELSEDDDDSYDTDNGGGYDSFRIDGGAAQSFDAVAVAVYNATITYTDGTTAKITATIFQDTNGKTYLAPERIENSDHTALSAKPIAALSLDTVQSNSGNGIAAEGNMWAYRVADSFIEPVDGTMGNDSMVVGYTDAGGDRITTVSDVIFGHAGHDTIRAGAGADTLDGGSGNDALYGEGGDDLLDGGTGNDLLDGGLGIDTATFAGPVEDYRFDYGPAGQLIVTDLVANRDGVDSLTGIEFAIFGKTKFRVVSGDDGSNTTLQGVNDGTQTLIVAHDGNDWGGGHATADAIFGGTGSDTLDGGDGNDTLIGEDGNDLLRGDGGDDRIDGGENDDTLLGALGNDTLFGGDGADRLDGGDGADVLDGGTGDDALDGGAGADLLRGGAGNDRLLGGTGNDTLFGGGNNDSIFGGNDADTLYGDAGNDYLAGEAGTDLVSGGDGNDTLLYADGNDTLLGGADADTFLVSQLGNVSIEGGETGVDDDTIDLGALTAGVTVTRTGIEAGTITNGTGTITFSGIERLVLTGQDDVVGKSFFGSVHIDAGAGHDVIEGSDQSDTISGGDGQDYLRGWKGNDSILGGAGADYIQGDGGRDTLVGGDGDDTLDSWRDASFLSGGNDADTFQVYDSWYAGNFDGVTIVGGEGGVDDDTINLMYFGSGATVTYTGIEAGTVTDGTQTLTFSQIERLTLTGQGDTVDARAATGGVTLDGAGGNDSLTGGAGADTLLGGAGSDTLAGGAGADLLSGGDGADTFVVAGGFGNDTVLGGEGAGTGTDADTLDLRGVTQAVTVVFTGAGAGTLTDGAHRISFSEVESLRLGAGADSVDFSGDTGGMVVDAGAGSDSLLGGSGSDRLMGGAGDDTLGGGGGDDTLWGDVGSDTFVIGAGDGHDLIYGSEETGDADTLRFAGGATSGVTVTFAGWEHGSYTFGGATGSFWEVERIEGTAGNDVFDARASGGALVADGGAGNDLIRGGTGNDRLFGGLGGDTIHGGDGDDYIEGGDGDDFLTTGLGRDTLIGGDGGNDTLMNSDGDDSLVGGAGNDSIIATGGNDTLEGGSGDDLIRAGTGDDHARGGDGNDTFVVEDGFGNDTLEGGEGGSDVDTIDLSRLSGPITVDHYAAETGQITDGTNTIAFGGIERFVLTSHADFQTSGADTVGHYTDAGAGDDTIFGGLGDDTYLGGEGADVIYADAGDDHVSGGAGDDDLGGNEGRDTLLGGAGNDYLQGMEGDDSLEGGAGDDTLLGRSGADVLSGGDGRDTFLLEGGFGNDTIVGGEGGADVDTIDLGRLSGPVTVTYKGDESGTFTDGTHTVQFSQIEHVVLTDGADVVDGRADTAGIWVDGGDGDDSIAGGSGGDAIDGGAGADSIDAHGGGDEIRAGAGDDRVTLSGGNDTVFLEDGNDAIVVRATSGTSHIDGGTGTDTLEVSAGSSASGYTVTAVEDGSGSYTHADGASGSYAGFESYRGSAQADRFDLRADGSGTDVSAGAGDDTVLGGAWHDKVVGGSGNDSLDGGGGDDTLDGSDGDDTLSGGHGNDSLIGWIGHDRLYGGDGDDLLDTGEGDDAAFGEAGNDTLLGWTGNDSLDGGAGHDSLHGGAGNDSLAGGAGDDTLTGGAGDDRFVYAAGDGHDVITDFGAGATGLGDGDGDGTNNDHIDLTAFYDNLSELRADHDDDGILNQSNAFDGRGRTVDYTDNARFGDGSLRMQSTSSSAYTAEATGVVCFVAGTRIATPRGPVAVENLRAGDLLRTRGGTAQPLLWVGRTALALAPGTLDPARTPVRLAPLAGERALRVSPQHCLLVEGPGGATAFARARHLAEETDLAAFATERAQVVYHHLLLPRHDVLLSDGRPSESFYPGAQGMRMMPALERARLLCALPRLDPASPDATYGPRAQRVLSRAELREGWERGVLRLAGVERSCDLAVRTVG